MTENEYQAIVTGIAETRAYFESQEATDEMLIAIDGVVEAIGYQLRIQFPKFDTEEFIKSCGAV
jgi:hypothetical protein